MVQLSLECKEDRKKEIEKATKNTVNKASLFLNVENIFSFQHIQKVNPNVNILQKSIKCFPQKANSAG
ncbi:MAG: hypothetical protein PHH37_08750 [Paludibacter sp.]|nr:hypothetical protein [Paludibacter sp.]